MHAWLCVLVWPKSSFWFYTSLWKTQRNFLANQIFPNHLAQNFIYYLLLPYFFETVPWNYLKDSLRLHFSVSPQIKLKCTALMLCFSFPVHNFGDHEGTSHRDETLKDPHPTSPQQRLDEFAAKGQGHQTKALSELSLAQFSWQARLIQAPQRSWREAASCLSRTAKAWRPAL